MLKTNCLVAYGLERFAPELQSKSMKFCRSRLSLNIEDAQYLFTQTTGYTQMSQHRRLPVGASLTWSYL